MTMGFLTGTGHSPQHGTETPADRAASLQRAIELVRMGEAEIAAGLGIEDATMDEWLAALDEDPDCPLPRQALDRPKP